LIHDVNGSLTGFLSLFSPSDSVHRLTHQHIELVRLLLKTFQSNLEFILCLLLLCGQFAQLGFEIYIQFFPQGDVDIVNMMDLFGESLGLIACALQLRHKFIIP
jgi:hypothetical protein